MKDPTDSFAEQLDRVLEAFSRKQLDAIIIANRVSNRSAEVFLQFAKRSSRDRQGGMPSRQIMLRRLSGINKQDVSKGGEEKVGGGWLEE